MAENYLNVTDFFDNNTGADVADKIQQIIDNNPNRTIFFPDGEYIISKPILTSAVPEESVSLLLSNYAHIKASDDWQDSEAMIRLGGKNPANNNFAPGSNYGLDGGIVDGNGKAAAVSIDSGRETFVRNTSIKNARIGLHIKHGANSGSSDCDISNINIVGTKKKDSIGMLIQGFDNTFSNIRICCAFIGVQLESGGNILRNIHPLYIFGNEEADADYDNSIAFFECGFDNYYDFCYSDNLATGFYIKESRASYFHNCRCMYYSERGNRHCGFRTEGAFNCVISDFKMDFIKKEPENNVFLSVGEEGGCGIIQNFRMQEQCTTDYTYKKYLKGNLIKIV